MKSFFILAWIFFLLVWIPVESAWTDFCFNNYDLGIYAQAIELLSWNNLNPWLSTRDVFLFNDHFDPILFILTPLRGLLPSGLLAIRTEMIALLLAAIAPVWLWRRGCLSHGLAIICGAIILFSPMTLDAAYYPAHPGTWSMAPLSWMLSFLLAEKFGWALFMLIVTLACKEEYPFVGAVIGLVFFVNQKKRPALAFIGLSLFWALVVFFIRPRLLGPSDMYTDAVSSLQGISMLSDGEAARTLLRRIVELGLPIFVMFYGARKPVLKWLVIPISVLIAMFSVRLAGGYWGNHRTAPLAVVCAFIIAYGWRNNPLTKRRVQLISIIILVLAFPAIELGSRFWRGKSFKKHCPHDPVRLTEINTAIKILRERVDGAVLAQGNLIPPAVDLPQIAHLGATSTKSFKYLLIEKGAYRNSWPMSSDQIRAVESAWRIDSNVVEVFEGAAVVLLERSH